MTPEYAVTVRQLPDAKSLFFKTLQSYSNGQVDRWIELDDEESADGHGHGHPAPRLDLKAAAPGAKHVSPSPSEEPTAVASSPEPSNETPSAEPAADSAEGDDGMPIAVPLGIGAGILALGGGVWWFRSRRSESA
ncbi:DUF1775 domain-containing protein [Streptomyces europaeiscabiei]|uniref:DUF1775 domain-containing protein n=1 Tax=Streptomyces europaeiscabiei TaxID=146819 RepID=UPI002E19D881